MNTYNEPWEDDEWWKTATFTEVWRIIYDLQEKRDIAAYNGDDTTAIDNKRLSLIKKINEKRVLEDITTKNVSSHELLSYTKIVTETRSVVDDDGKTILVSYNKDREQTVAKKIDDQLAGFDKIINTKGGLTLKELIEQRVLLEAKKNHMPLHDDYSADIDNENDENIKTQNVAISQMLQKKENVTVENGIAVVEAEQVGVEFDAKAKKVLFERLKIVGGFIGVNDYCLDKSVLNTEVYDKDGKLNNLYNDCDTLVKNLEYTFDEDVTAGEREKFTKQLNASLMANAAHRAAQKLLVDRGLYDRNNGNIEAVREEFKKELNNQFKRSLTLAVLASNEATAVAASQITIGEDGKVYFTPEKNDSAVKEIVGIVDAINDGKTIIEVTDKKGNVVTKNLTMSPLAVEMDGYLLDKETDKFAKDRRLEVAGKLSFWEKTKNVYQGAKKALFNKENIKKFLGGMAIMGTATAFMASSSLTVVAAGAAIYAGYTFINAWVMPAIDKDKANKLSVEALKQKWKDKEFTRSAKLRTAEGLSVGAIIGFMGPVAGAAKIIKHGARVGIIGVFKGIPTYFSNRRRKAQDKKLDAKISIETYKALKLYKARYEKDKMNLYSGLAGYAIGATLAETGVLQSLVNNEVIKETDQMLEDLRNQCKSYLNIDSDISAQTNLNDVSDTDVRDAEIEANKASWRSMMASFKKPHDQGAQELTDTLQQGSRDTLDLQQGSRDTLDLQQGSRDTLDLQQGSRDSVVMQQSQDSLQRAEFQQEDEILAAKEAAAQAQAATPETLEINGKTYTVIGEPKEMGNGVRAVYLKNADGEPFVQYEGLKGGLWSEEQALARANLLANVNKHNPNFTFSDGSTVETNIEIMKERIEEGFVTLPEGMHENQAIYLAMMKARYLGDDSLLKALQCGDVDLTKELTELSNKFSVNGEIGTLITEEPLRMSVGATTKLDPSCMPTSDINYSGGQNTEILDASKTTIDTDVAERQLDMKAAVDGEVKSPEVYSASRNDTTLDSADGEAFRYNKKTDELHYWDKDGAKTNIIDENGNPIETGLKEHGRNGIEFYTQNPAPEAVNELIRELPKPQYVSIEKGTATYVFEYEKGQVELKLTYPDANGVEHGTLVVDGIEVPLNQEGCKALAERMTEVTGQKFTSVDGPEQDATHNITVKDHLVEKRAKYWGKVIKSMGEGIDGNGAGAEDIAGSSLKFVHEQVTLTPELKQAIQENGEFAFVKFNDDGRAILRVAGVDGVSEIAVQAPVSVPIVENSSTISVDINKETGAYEAVINAGDHEIKISDTHQYNSDTNEWNDVVVTVDGQQALLDSKTAGAVETMVEKALLEKHIEADVNLHQPASFSQKVVAAIETGQNKAGLSRVVMQQMSAYKNK